MEQQSIILAVKMDNERQAIEQLLQEMDLRVFHASTGEETILLLEDTPDPDLLITEMKLGDMHAWKLISELKERVKLSELPILLISDQEQIKPLENVSVLMRPVGLTQLRRKVSLLLQLEDGNELPFE